jgi:hypothetical protein
MRVFHADAVAAVDVILEPFKVGEGRVIVGARDFEEGPDGPNGLGRQSTRRTQSGIRSSRGESFVEIMPTAEGPAIYCTLRSPFALYSALPWRLLTNRSFKRRLSRRQSQKDLNCWVAKFSEPADRSTDLVSTIGVSSFA